MVPICQVTPNCLYDREIAYWVDCLINKKEPLVKAEEAAQVMIYRSSDNGNAINLI
ncbi:MAG TPA: hypothetical protein PK512_01095 [bacterium]|mgnify:FL=1|jgi:hypothetical protein|nr:hypothetical protein [bacterium]